MWNLRTLAAAVVVLALVVGSGCVSQATYNAEHQKAVELRKDLEKAKASLKADENALEDKVSELTKKGEANLAMAKERAAAELKKQTEALESTMKKTQAALARREQVYKAQAAAFAEKTKEVDILKAQLKAEQDKVLKLTEELEAAKKAATPAAPAQ